ncbi:MAG: hypothetical protein BYD32DRAFT_414803 [Podila humilis]|nr:MAG: hypothetical protein BYD32DRAFT_414803 [Podila humilis]
MLSPKPIHFFKKVFLFSLHASAQCCVPVSFLSFSSFSVAFLGCTLPLPLPLSFSLTLFFSLPLWESKKNKTFFCFPSFTSLPFPFFILSVYKSLPRCFPFLSFPFCSFFLSFFLSIVLLCFFSRFVSFVFFIWLIPLSLSLSSSVSRFLHSLTIVIRVFQLLFSDYLQTHTFRLPTPFLLRPCPAERSAETKHNLTPRLPPFVLLSFRYPPHSLSL